MVISATPPAPPRAGSFCGKGEAMLPTIVKLKKTPIFVSLINNDAMNTLTLDIQRAELARKILNETDERLVMALTRYFGNAKSLAHKAPSAKEVTFNSISLDTRNYKFNRDEANAR
jgi:hypothetical protein